MSVVPIKRSKSLVSLSKDHHEGLLIVWKVRHGIRNLTDEKRIAAFILYAFDKHLEPHFLLEENLLFIKVSNEDELLKAAIEQHEAIRTIVSALRATTDPSLAQLEAFATLAEEHIRFEERKLFVHLESIIPSETLAIIGASLETANPPKKPIFWKDEFWLTK